MIKNKASFNFEDLYLEFGPESLHNIKPDIVCSAISIDTRTLQKGEAFVALVGQNSDGHKRIEDSFKLGASFAIVNKDWFLENKLKCESYPLVVSENTEIALGKLGALHRSRFDYPIIAIAGSNGKTSTKEMAAGVLSEKYNVLKTYKNFNNQLGVPLMLLALDSSYDVAVLELGTNSPGEIKYLCQLARPTRGLITNIGKEHLEQLIDLDGVEMEETALFTHLLKHSGMCFINLDDGRIAPYKKVLKKRITYGTGDKAGNLAATIQYDEDMLPALDINMEGNLFSAKIQSPGYSSAINAMAATAVGFGMDLSSDEIKSGLEKFRPSSEDSYGRMRIMKANGYTILNDCYNANPSSVENSLDILGGTKMDGKKIAVLGDMLELGENSTEEHKFIIEKALGVCDYLFLFGDEYKTAFGNVTVSQANKVIHFSSLDGISKRLISTLLPKDIVLVKASRGIKLELIINSIIK